MVATMVDSDGITSGKELPHDVGTDEFRAANNENLHRAMLRRCCDNRQEQGASGVGEPARECGICVNRASSHGIILGARYHKGSRRSISAVVRADSRRLVASAHHVAEARRALAINREAAVAVRDVSALHQASPTDSVCQARKPANLAFDFAPKNGSIQSATRWPASTCLLDRRDEMAAASRGTDSGVVRQFPGSGSV